MAPKKNFLNNRFSEKGQGLVEYALILMLAGLVVYGIAFALGPQIEDVFSRFVDRAPVAPPALLAYTPPPTLTPTPTPNVNLCHTLTLNANPTAGGNVTASPAPDCNGTQYRDGTMVTISASAETTYEFGNWSGDATGSNPSVTIRMNENKTVTATFSQFCYTAIMTASPGDGGLVTAAPAPNCGANKYIVGTDVTFTAVPAIGQQFVDWAEDASGNNLSATLTVDGNKRVTANFTPLCYTLTTAVAPSGSGVVEKSADSPAPNCAGNKYTHGTIIVLLGTGAGLNEFTYWSGDAGGNNSSTVVTMDRDKSITGNFGQVCNTLTTDVSPLNSGTINFSPQPNCGNNGYTSDITEVILTASANQGHTFINWSGAASGTAVSASVTMDGNKSVTANFSSACYSLNMAVSPANSGTVNISPPPNCNGNQYNPGTQVTFTANPNSGNLFSGWSRDLSGSTNPETLTMNAPHSVTANFSPISLGNCEYLENDGRIVIEAEHYFDTAPGSGNASNSSWEPVTSPSGYVASHAMQAQPNTGVNAGDNSNGPRLDYHIYFQNTGDYEIWVRANGANNSNDSLHVGFGSIFTTGSYGLSGFVNNQYEWRRWNTPISVSNTGLQTLNVWMREDGLNFDRIYLVKTDNSSGLSNGSTAAGPGESSAPAGCTNPIAQNTLDITFAGTGSGSVTVAPPGTPAGACTGNCQKTYTNGTAVTLSATPATGSRFIGWSGDADCSDSNVTINSNVSCTARFNTDIPFNYIRLVGDSEVNGNEWTSVAELNLLDGDGTVVNRSPWSISFVDSEETTGESSPASNAIDGNTNSIWHTEWYDADPVHPHDLQINLGQASSISGFRYLPRQNSQNGRIENYRFCASVDGSTWYLLSNGVFPNTNNEQSVTFTPVTSLSGLPPCIVNLVPRTIADENFESDSWSGGTGWLNNWSIANEANLTSNDNPHGGTYHLRLRDDGQASRSANLSSLSTATLEFYWKARSMENSDRFYAEISDDGGTTWNEIMEVQPSDADNSYHQMQISLDGYLVNNFSLRFSGVAVNGGQDYFYIDDITISGN